MLATGPTLFLVLTGKAGTICGFPTSLDCLFYIFFKEDVSAPLRLCARKRFLGFDLRKNPCITQRRRGAETFSLKRYNRQSSNVGKPHIVPALPVKTKNSVGPVASIASYLTNDLTECCTCHPNKHGKVSSHRIGRTSLGPPPEVEGLDQY